MSNEQMNKKAKVSKKRRQFVVIGIGMFGTSVAKTLYELGKDVVCIDTSEERVQAIANYVTHAVQADARDETILERLGIENFDVAVVCIGNNIEASLMITLALQELGVKQIITKATTEVHKRALYKIGADMVVLPEKEMGVRVAKGISVSTLIDYIELSDEYSIFEIRCPEMWIEQNALELNVRQNYKVTILGIKRAQEFIVMTEKLTEFQADDVIILLGAKEDFYKQLEQFDN